MRAPSMRLLTLSWLTCTGHGASPSQNELCPAEEVGQTPAIGPTSTTRGTSDTAQNINFAIRGSLAKVFLMSNGIDYSEALGEEVVSPEKAADLLGASTSLVKCIR